MVFYDGLGVEVIEYIETVATYGRLEGEIRGCMTALCGPVCTRCAMPCCRIDFCRESLESPFLTSVRARFAPDAQWNPAAGWLTPHGCRLSVGRPPVCYEFLCHNLEAHQPTPLHREALQLLSKLMTHAGACARGRRHLVELNDLSRLNFKRLTVQFDRARATLIQLQRFWGHADADALRDEPDKGKPREAVA
jgi:hypothetical protein